MDPMFVVLYHPFIVLEILIRGGVGSAVTAGVLCLLRPRDPRIRHVAWIAVLFVVPAMFPLWFAVPEIEIAGLPGSGLLVSDLATPVIDSSMSVSNAPHLLSSRRGLPKVVTAWLVIAALRLGWIANGAVAVTRLRRSARTIECFGSPPVRVAVSERVAVPVTAGVLSPTILLPADSDRWKDSRRSAVLLHEFAHVRRWDLVTTWLSEVVVALFWFNPISWLARRELLKAAEEAADAAAATRMPSRRAYAAELVSIAETMVGRSKRVLGHLDFGRSGLERRVQEVLRARSTGSPMRLAIGIAGSVLLCAGLASLAASVTPERSLPTGAADSGSIPEPGASVSRAHDRPAP